ncbi:TonB-dependent receptor [Duganella guangzhouensis]|nr:TonB-dependent receptor [Duganella guangzhouensis]
MKNYPNMGQRKIIAALIASVVAQQAIAQQKNDEIPEVVVTAQKRSESASRTPLALTAMTAEDLTNRGISNASDLTNVTPNVQIGTADGGNTNIYIRGIGSNNTTEAGDPAAAFHLDGVYLARPDEARAAFFDISRVEVLRGPQGTLYGRNATAGAVNVITAKPEDTFGGKFSFEVGSYRERRAEGMLNIPVNDMLALRVAVMGEHHDNYVGNSTTNNSQNTVAGRVHALLKIAQGNTLLLSADRTQLNGPDNPGVPLPLAASKGSAGQYNTDSLAADDRATYSGVSAEWNYDIGATTFTYLGAHRTKSKEHSALDVGSFGNSASGSTNDTSQNSHEFRLSSNGTGLWKWVGGLYLFKESQEAWSTFGNGVLVSYTPNFESKSRAAFGQATYSLTDAIRLTAGLRSTRDEKHSHDATSTFNFGTPVVSLTNADKSWSNTDGKLGIDYEISKGTMLYSTYTTAYKAGGFNGSNAAANLPVTYYSPEKLRALEAGVKTKFWGNKGQFNASAFHYDYKDLQVGTIVSVGQGAGSSVVNNAASATINGAEADVKVKVSADGRFDASLAYTDAKYDNFNNCVYEPTNEVKDCSGNSLRNAPKATLALGYEHQVSLENGATVVLRADTRFSAKYYNDDTNSALFAQGGYRKSDISARYNSPDYKWYTMVYVRNLENRNILASRYPAVVGRSYGYTAPPRTMGVSVGTSF